MASTNNNAPKTDHMISTPPRSPSPSSSCSSASSASSAGPPNRAETRVRIDALHARWAAKAARAEAYRAKKLLDAPSFTISISAPPTLSLSQPTYQISATVTYNSDPATVKDVKHAPRPVLFRPSYGPLSPWAPDQNLYSIYTSPTCEPESRIIHARPNASLRAPRNADGSFVKEEVISSLEGWEEVHLGDTVTREVTVGLDDFRQWRQHLHVGQRYWIRCDDLGLFGGRKGGLDPHWRYGEKEKVELPMRVSLRGGLALPVGVSNVVGFEVVE